MSSVNQTYAKPVPAIDSLTAPYWMGALDRRLLLQYCVRCGRPQFYPRAHCTECGGRELVWKAASGRGSVHTFSVIYRTDTPGFSAEAPYVFAIVELEEGPRLTANILAPHVEVSVGMPVQAAFVPISERLAIPQFEKAA